MRFEKIIRAQGMLIGLGAALLLASAARAQQEVEPTTFEVVPGVPGGEKAAAAAAAHNPEAAKQMKGKAAGPVAPQSDSEATSQESVAVFTAGEVAGLLVLLTGIGMLVVSALVGRWPKRYRNRFHEKKIRGQRA